MKRGLAEIKQDFHPIEADLAIHAWFAGDWPAHEHWVKLLETRYPTYDIPMQERLPA